MTHAFVSASRSGKIVHGRFADGRMRHEKYCFACLSPRDGNKQVWGSRKKTEGRKHLLPTTLLPPCQTRCCRSKRNICENFRSPSRLPGRTKLLFLYPLRCFGPLKGKEKKGKHSCIPDVTGARVGSRKLCNSFPLLR